MMRSIGKLRHRITIQTVTTAADGGGGGASTLATHVKTWARVRPLTARERFFTGQISPSTSHSVEIRYREGITADMEILYGSRRFKILGIRNIEERDDALELNCEEQPAEAT